MLSSIPNLSLAALGAGLFYIFGVIAYRLTLHPLAKHPGPFWAKITTWYDTYHCYLKDRHVDQLKCQRKYGNIFRYGPDYLVIQTAEGLKDIYTNAKMNPIQKGPQYNILRDYGTVSTHGAIDRDVHAFKRRVLGHAFSEQALRSLESLMIETIDKWLVALGSDASDEHKGWSIPKNMATYANYVTFDVLGDLCFGRPFGLLESDELRGIPAIMLIRAKILGVLGNSPIRHLYKLMQEKTPLEKYILPWSYYTMMKFRNFATGALKDRFASQAEIEKSNGTPRKDFIHYLSQGKDPVTGKGYTQHEMLVELRLLIVAGSDTSSVVMAAAFFYLARHPKILERLQKELRSTFTNVNDIVTGPQLSSCHFLRAIIDESLRLAPPVTSSLQRQIIEPGMVIDGVSLPAGINVGTSSFAIHRSPEYFPDPLKFMPERWLPEHTPKEDIDRAKSAFCPFSLGNRGCIGKPMAYNELSIALGRVFWTYDIRLAPGDVTGEDTDGLYELGDIFVAERDGPLIEFKKYVEA